MPNKSGGAGTSLRRVSSGIAGLDTVLNGGLMLGCIYIVQGTPGAGKTILSNQICFHHASLGGKAIFATLLAENHARMMDNISNLSFFDDRLVPESVKYLSGFAEMSAGGLDALAKLLRREIQAQRASMLVIDGLVSAQASAERAQDFKMFIHDLQEIALATDCTMVLTTNAGESLSPEQTMVDGIIVLTDTLYGWRSESNLQVRKFRGSGFLRGRHSYQITDDGMMVYPRIESKLPSRLALPALADKPISTGIAGLDAMIGGGLSAASNTALVGASGVGKTSAGLQFVGAASAAEPGLFFGFYEHPDALLGKADSLGLKLRALVDAGIVQLRWEMPTRDPLDAYGERLLAIVRDLGVRRLFLDGLTALKTVAVDPSRIGGFFSALLDELRALGVTTVYSLELPILYGPIVSLPIDDISQLAENVVLMRHLEDQHRSRRTISVLKVRDSAFDAAIYPFSITDRGVIISAVDDGTDTPSPRSDNDVRSIGAAGTAATDVTPGDGED